MTTIPTADNSLAAAATTAAKNAASAAAAKASSSSAESSSTALSSLTSNFNTFLTLLTTQLQNQDPTSPMSSDTFTSELAQFAGVEQQVKTNTNLGQLISQGQSSAISSGQALIGDTVNIAGNRIALQNGAAALQFTATTAEPVALAITDNAGASIRTVQFDVSQGANTWVWDGTNDSGAHVSDGAYTAAIVAGNGVATPENVDFTSIGVVTSVKAGPDGTPQVTMGAAALPLSSVTGVAGKQRVSN